MRAFVTLITGATRGIGHECARQLVAAGHQLVGLAREPADFPGELVTVDAADRDALDTVLADLQQRYAFTGLVNNVGAAGAQTIDELTFEVFDTTLQINLGAAIQCTQAVLPAMRRAHYGRIVNISSELALGLPTRTAYGSAKAAMISATRTWAMELGADAITVNAIAPGPIDTVFFNRSNPPGSPERDRKLARIPLGRFGDPADVANAVAFLMAPASGYITGQTLFVDGGSSLGSSGLP